MTGSEGVLAYSRADRLFSAVGAVVFGFIAYARDESSSEHAATIGLIVGGIFGAGWTIVLILLH